MLHVQPALLGLLKTADAAVDKLRHCIYFSFYRKIYEILAHSEVQWKNEVGVLACKLVRKVTIVAYSYFIVYQP